MPDHEHILASDTLLGLSILIVDDEADARELLAQALSSLGAEVRVVGGAEQARCALATYTPDVLIADIGMPDEDGYSLMRSIRALTHTAKRHIPAIALTAFSSPAARDRAVRSGFDMHLAKPVQPWILAETLREMAKPTSSARV
jgi:CheY-like chemotaxis protein